MPNLCPRTEAVVGNHDPAPAFGSPRSERSAERRGCHLVPGSRKPRQAGQPAEAVSRLGCPAAISRSGSAGLAARAATKHNVAAEATVALDSHFGFFGRGRPPGATGCVDSVAPGYGARRMYAAGDRAVVTQPFLYGASLETRRRAPFLSRNTNGAPGRGSRCRTRPLSWPTVKPRGRPSSGAGSGRRWRGRR